MAPTTLITFLVRTPPSTRSVQLYGSWDNFAIPYPMQHDTRIGAEHWSGCHSFSNIICDGDVSSSATPRHGGLKMGGIYWYYYTLDHEIEFHNSAEPSTTTCPMLPGQLVNVLNVPFALNHTGRPRTDSGSSAKSEYRTMNPTDKFLNPRPVPTKPSLPRLKTSPTFRQQQWSSSSSPTSSTSVSSFRGRSLSTRAASPPNSAKILALVRPAPPSAKAERSTSRGSNRSVGIIGGLRALASPLMISPGVLPEQSSTGTKSPAVHSRDTSVRSTTRRQPASGAALHIVDAMNNLTVEAGHDLAFRRDAVAPQAVAAVPISSFAQHRRQRSLSREPSSLRNSQQLAASPNMAVSSEKNLTHQPLETVTEVASALNTPVWPVTALKVGGEDSGRQLLDLEKRLPTLPNTPSSAYPSSAVTETVDLANLQSHFSCTTIDSEPCIDSYICNELSRFSDWTDAPSGRSPESTHTLSIFDFEPMSPPADFALGSTDDAPIEVGEQIEDQSTGERTHVPDGLPSAYSFSTVSSVASSAAPSSHPDPDSATSGHFSWSKFQHYTLPAQDTGSGVTIKAADSVDQGQPLVLQDNKQQRHDSAYPEPAIAHSTSMQQLLDELSYLGGMIRQH